MSIYTHIVSKIENGRKQLAVLIDPDKVSGVEVGRMAEISQTCGVDYFFIGGSLLTNDNLDCCIENLRKHSSIPVVLFPGNTLQINAKADAILFLSLISGRNPEMLIGKHVVAAPYLRASMLEVIPTGYMLIESGKPTTALYMSNSTPIPSDKDDIAVCTALAGEMLGLKLIYADAGSGAERTVTPSMIRNLKKNISIPLIIGGGIRSAAKAKEIYDAGADIIVIGNAIEKNSRLISDIREAGNAL
ncbi:MAG: geranylgeranylglyceryl/heptaprenylglyceryl phosphate synthase [Bacteroidota bacterium]